LLVETKTFVQKIVAAIKMREKGDFRSQNEEWKFMASFVRTFKRKQFLLKKEILFDKK